jgi:hypothetical protein
LDPILAGFSLFIPLSVSFSLFIFPFLVTVMFDDHRLFLSFFLPLNLLFELIPRISFPSIVFVLRIPPMCLHLML